MAGDESSTILRPRLEGTEALNKRLAFLVSAGPDRNLRFLVDGPRTLIGKSPACAVKLADGLVSRRHAALDATPEGTRLTDLGSANGTWVNGVRIKECFLVGGEQLRLGDTVIDVHATSGGGTEQAPRSEAMRFGRTLGKSAVMRALYTTCETLAKTDIPIVIEGETGTGKEVLAESLHEMSHRADKPFVVFDCTAVPPSLVESVLFGHERGAFTGATNSRKGVFEDAHGGTLFIDEIGELDVMLQPKLLRALERSEVQRVGANAWHKVDVRIIAATRRDLDREVQAGRFRDDLFFRLAVGRVEIPPLRDRQGDIALLARHFWRALGGDDQPLPQSLLNRLEDYAWPGNVRELHNTILRALALGADSADATAGLDRAARGTQPPPADAPEISAGDSIERVLARDLPLARAREDVVEDFERRYVQRVLAKHGGNVVRAAQASGIARRYFQILRARHAR